MSASFHRFLLTIGEAKLSTRQLRDIPRDISWGLTSLRFDKPNVWFEDRGVTWAELVRLLRQHGFEELRSGKGSHRQFWNPETKRVITVAVHTKKEVGTGLLNRILKDAGIKESKH